MFNGDCMKIWITEKTVHIECENENEARGLAKGIRLAQGFMKQVKQSVVE